MAAKPHLLKKGLTPMGEAIIGVQEKKCLELSNRLSNAIPKPSLVTASRTP